MENVKKVKENLDFDKSETFEPTKLQQSNNHPTVFVLEENETFSFIGFLMGNVFVMFFMFSKLLTKWMIN